MKNIFTYLLRESIFVRIVKLVLNDSLQMLMRLPVAEFLGTANSQTLRFKDKDHCYVTYRSCTYDQLSHTHAINASLMKLNFQNRFGLVD